MLDRRLTCSRLRRLVQAKGLLGEQDSQGTKKEENDYLASNMKFDEQEHEQLMLEAQNMDKVLSGEQVCPLSSGSTPLVHCPRQLGRQAILHQCKAQRYRCGSRTKCISAGCARGERGGGG